MVALLAALCAPSAARASCGDHVVSPTPAAHRSQPAPGHLPCTGPFCSSPQQAPDPMPAPAYEQAEMWGCLPARPLVAAADGGPRRWTDFCPSALRRSYGIFHPPRASL